MNLMQLTIECSKQLQALRQEAIVGRQQAAAINDGSRAPTPADLAALTQLYRSLCDTLLFRYGQAAAAYRAKGVDLLHNALEEELHDFQTALQVLAQIEGDQMRHEAHRQAVLHQAQTEVGRILSEAHANQVRAHEEHNRRWSAAFNYRPMLYCPGCARPMSYHGYCGFCGWR